MSLALFISACCVFGTEPTDLVEDKTRTFQACFIRPETLQVRPTDMPARPARIESSNPQRFDLAFDQVHSFVLSLKGSSNSAICKILAKSESDEIVRYLATCAVPIQVDAEDWLRIDNGDSVFRIFVLDRSLVIPSVNSIRTNQDHTVIDLLANTDHDGDLVMYMELLPPPKETQRK